jgi:ectoine hydroxylase-related dioxygenase (phytanoyl-CoA dioxygenase family)
VRTIARSGVVRSLVEPVLGPNCFAVRGILFDKTPEANWKVVWHQDLTIAVQQKREAPGFGPWSEKAGVTHVQPPMEILERMLAVRLHLDDCGMENGPLRVLPGSHRTGRLSATDIAAWRERTPETICAALRGSALLMQPLLLHASSAAGVAAHRRVLHLEWAAAELPHELCWQNEVR